MGGWNRWDGGVYILLPNLLCGVVWCGTGCCFFFFSLLFFCVLFLFLLPPPSYSRIGFGRPRKRKAQGEGRGNMDLDGDLDVDVDVDVWGMTMVLVDAGMNEEDGGWWVVGWLGEGREGIGGVGFL